MDRPRFDNRDIQHQFFNTRAKVNELAHWLSATATHLRQLDGELAPPEAIVAGTFQRYATTTLEYHDDSLYHDVGKTPLELLNWLTGGNRLCPMDLPTVQALVRQGLSEPVAKKASIAFAEWFYRGYTEDVVAGYQ